MVNFESNMLNFIVLLCSHLVTNLLHCVLNHLGQVQDEIETVLAFWGKYLQRVLGVDKAALQFLPFAWVWPVAVDQGDQVGEPPELGHL